MAKFVVTAGHSDTDPGAIGIDGRTEAALATQLRDIVAGKLSERGHTVLTDGKWRQNSPLNIALRLIGLAPVAVEIHFNASANPMAHGVECISLPKHRPLAQALANAIARRVSTQVRGLAGWIDQSKSARGRLAFVSAGGIIIETTFITSRSDMQGYMARYFLVAQAIADTLERYAAGDI